MSDITLYSLSDYNAGKLIPHTFDLSTIDSQEEWLEAVAKWLKSVDKQCGNDIYTPPREEWIVCDYDGIPRAYVGEYDIDPSYWEYKNTVDSSNLDGEVFDAAAELDIEPDMAEELYQGEYSSDKDFAYQMAEDIGAINEEATWPNNHIDWDSAARDLMMDYGESGGHYFRTSY